MKKITFLLCLIVISFSSFAQQISKTEAETVAKSFFLSQNKNFSRCAKTIENELGTLLYIFNAENAFVVISGDKNTQPVLAFVDNQIFNESDVVPPFQMWLDNYAEQVASVKRLAVLQEQFVNQWDNLLQGASFKNNAEILPLMISQWDQDTYYNYYCPKDASGPNGRVVTGCVATAMAQLIYYFRFPDTGVGEYSYVDENYGEQYANYGETHYNYNAMCDKPTTINTEISKLIYHCGVGVDMVYGPSGSGMYNHSAAKVLRTYFKFSPSTEYLFRDSTNLDWDSVIVSHLSKQIPMYYAGWSLPNINGHGFICDGYKMVDSSYYYHFNFGWSGYMDGYFYTNALNVNNSHFNLAQELIVNAYPDTINYEYPPAEPVSGSMTLTSVEGTFTDGSLSLSNYAKNRNFTWNIAPDVSNLDSITLHIDYSLAQGDTIIISDSYANVLKSITADTNSLTIVCQTENMSVEFISDDTLESLGFRATYTANQKIFCSGSKTFTSAQGHIEDGSGTYDYNNLSNCKFTIILPAYTAITVHINSVDLEENRDYLRFYKNTSISPNNLLLELTGQLYDTTIVFDTKRVNIILETDETNTADGFNLDYVGGYVGIADFDKTISAFPNPTLEILNINSASSIEKVEIFDMEGKLVYSDTPQKNDFLINLNNYPSGVYTLKLYSDKQFSIKKIVKY